MEHQNKKHMLPGFPATSFQQFTGLQNSGANALMSTLQSLQMQSLSNPILPQPNITSAEFSQRVFLEQMKAMQTMYASSFSGVKPDQAQPADMTAAVGSGLTFPTTNGINGASTSSNLSAGATIFPNTAANNFLNNVIASTSMASDKKSLPEDSPVTASSSTPSTSTTNDVDGGLGSGLAQVVHHPKAIHAMDFRLNNSLSQQSSLASFGALGSTLSALSSAAPTTSSLSDNWMNQIRLDSITQPSTSTSISDLSLPKVTLKKAEESTASPAQTTTTPVHMQPLETTAARRNETDYEKEAHGDDVMDMFGLDDGVDQNAAVSNFFGLPNRNPIANGGLSPIQFTPPDSPTEAFSTDMLFGLEPARTNSTPASCSSQPSTSTGISSLATLNNKEDKQSDGFKVPEMPAEVATPPPKKEPIYNRKFIKSNKIPVYKQKLNSLFDKDDEKKKKDPNADAFAFDDDDEEDALKPADMREKESDIFANCDVKSKNVYVPGIGFAISNEAPTQDLWRHVVPKKRHQGDFKHGAPGSSLLPASAIHEAQMAARMNDPAIVTIAESIRIRRNQRLACEFLKLTMSTDTECAKTASRSVINSDQPPLQKFIIKINTSYENLEPATPKKKRKKKNADSEDSDWEGFEAIRRRKKATKRISYELKPYNDRDISIPEWSIGGRLNGAYSEGASTRKNPSRRDNIDTVKYRLSKFGSAEGHLPKGTYVVCKADLTKDDCALWRVDNQNMLQKFPPRKDLQSNRLVYKSSSTYSGWCEQISSQYFRVAVKVLKQSRSETTIEPDIPLGDLFPAMAHEIINTNATISIHDPFAKNFPVLDEGTFLREPFKITLQSYLMALINHTLTLEYIQDMKGKNDWTFLQAVADIELNNKQLEKKIREHQNIDDGHTELLKKFTRIFSVPNEYYSMTKCQTCFFKPVSNSIQLFDCEKYDPDTLQLIIDDEEPQIIEPEKNEEPELAEKPVEPTKAVEIPEKTEEQPKADSPKPSENGNDSEIIVVDSPEPPKEAEKLEDTDGEKNEKAGEDTITIEAKKTVIEVQRPPRPPSPLPSMDLLTCQKCADACESLHKLYHVKINMLRCCEEKLEIIGTQHPEYSPEHVVDTVKKDKHWVAKIITEFSDMYKNIRTNYA